MAVPTDQADRVAPMEVRVARVVRVVRVADSDAVLDSADPAVRDSQDSTVMAIVAADPVPDAVMGGATSPVVARPGEVNQIEVCPDGDRTGSSDLWRRPRLARTPQTDRATQRASALDQGDRVMVSVVRQTVSDRRPVPRSEHVTVLTKIDGRMNAGRAIVPDRMVRLAMVRLAITRRTITRRTMVRTCSV